ncbi:MAG: hypothetical protein ABJB03_00820 [Rhodoglobus sp.]
MSDPAPTDGAAPDAALEPALIVPPTAAGSDSHAAAPVAPEGTEPPPPPRKRRRIGWIVTVIVLVLALIATGVVLAIALTRLSEARDQINDQRDEIKHQKDLINEKETFSSAAQELTSTTAQFDGLPYATIVDTDYYASIFRREWTHRWSAGSVEADTEDVRSATQELEGVLATAKEQAASNGTGTFYESITDQLGAGYVTTSLDTADAACQQDVWGCVTSDEPFTIHYDESQTNVLPYMTDWLRTGLAYHEYAHVLQNTNPGPTDTAAAAFGDDWETMADCYALTELPGWSLDQRIYVSGNEYWDVSVGYGYTCDESQRQVIRDWVAALGYTHEPISQ